LDFFQSWMWGVAEGINLSVERGKSLLGVAAVRMVQAYSWSRIKELIIIDNYSDAFL
jgi:hypothetical protein